MRAAAFLVAVLCACTPAAAQTPLDLKPADLDHMPFRALVRVQTELGTKCTGFMVGPAIAMTAAHCLYLPRLDHYVQPRSVHVLLGYHLGQYRAHARVTRFVVATGYDPRAEAQTFGHDRAVLVLDHPIAPMAETLPPADEGASLPQPVRTAGWEQDRAEIATFAPDCAITGLAADATGAKLLRHDCKVTHGDSGAPVVATHDGRDVAVGMIVGMIGSTDLAIAVR